MSNIELIRESSGKVRAEKGVSRFYRDFFAQDSMLKPISYQCDIDVSKGELVDDGLLV